MRNLYTLILGVALLTSSGLFAQSNKDIAVEKALKAITLMDSGYYDQSIEMLRECIKLDPDNYDYPYEIGYAYYSKRDYNTAIRTLEKLKNHKDVTDQCYQLIGNAYDILGDTTNAFATYAEGIEKFPESGKLYLEYGNVYWGLERYSDALPYYEVGIEVDPQFPSNYYRAAILYCSSNNIIWGLMYGEIFMNLERNSDRTREISERMFNAYQEAIVFGDTSVSVNLCSNTLYLDDKGIKEMKKGIMPFCFEYGAAHSVAVAMTDTLTLASLVRLRSSVLDYWFQGDFAKHHDIALINFQKELKDLGHYDAYNYWLFMMGDPDGFDAWVSRNQSIFDSFANYFNPHPFEFSNKEAFHASDFR